MKPTGKGKLSKRDGEKFGIPVYPIEWKESESLTYKGFREIGFEIEAFINFICMIGWNPGTEDEIFTLETLTKIFDTKRIIKSGAKYDYEKAKWFNLEHLKKIETDSLKKEFENKILKANKDFLEEKMLDKLIDLAKNRINFRKNLAEETNKILSYDENKLRDNLLKINFNNGLIKLIEFFQKEIKTTNNLKDLKEKYFLKMKNLNIKVGDGMKGLRLSLTSEISGADLFTIIEILNIEIINYRLTNSLKIMYDKSRDN